MKEGCFHERLPRGKDYDKMNLFIKTVLGFED
jgi:hypothetical protein